MEKKNYKWGFLRETSEEARTLGYEISTGLKRTGLDEYLMVIFPDIHDWVYKTQINEEETNRKPDYRSESLKLIVEFDDIKHFIYPSIVKADINNTKYYETFGYKVIRIPYFIQLTNKAVKTLFGIEVQEQLFNEKMPSFEPDYLGSPVYFCKEGKIRMIKEFKKFPEQNRNNIKSMLSEINDSEYETLFYDESPKKSCCSSSNKIKCLNDDCFKKQWILKDKKSDLIGDILQKINYSIFDLNEEINANDYSRKSVIYQIVLSTWILEGSKKLPNLFRNDLIKDFSYKSDFYNKAVGYIKALRSFAMAHPLNTTNHGKYGFDGDFVCTDIYINDPIERHLLHNDRIMVLTIDGLVKPNKDNYVNDYWLKVYSEKKDKSNFFLLIGCSFNDLYNSVNSFVGYINSLDKHLSNKRLKDYK